MIRLRHALVFLAAALLGAAGCSEEPSSVELASVPMPEGGTVYTVAVLEGPDRLDVIAPSRAGLFVHRSDSGAWQRLEPRWPEALPERHAAPLRALGSATDSLNFPHSEVLTAHEGRLWMVSGVPGPDGTKLLMSANAGRVWSLVELPETSEAAEADPSAEPDEISVASTGALPSLPESLPASHVRLLNHGDDGLFLANATDLWRLTAARREVIGQESPWEKISLDGVDFSTELDGTALPTVIRHYLPATEERPFELLTLLRDKLFVHRRDAGEESWKQVSTLPMADRELIGVPGASTLLLLSPDGLYRSEDEADSWEKLSLPPVNPPDTQGVALEVMPPADETGAVILLSLDNGAIYRSPDGGQRWAEVRVADPDRRVVTDFTHSARRDRVWAATRGSGVLRSLDRGESWHQINDELRATRPFDVAVDDNGGLLLGSDAGLFRRVGSGGGQWQMLQNRATTALYTDRDSGATITGTASGAVVRLESDGKAKPAEAAPVDEQDNIVYQPMRFRGTELPRRAIVEIESRPDSQNVFAWSAREGPLMSIDGGVSWTRLSLNPAFRSALDGSFLSNFTTDFGERMYLITHAVSQTSPTQLWRSFNNGETWHAVRSFANGERRQAIFVDRNSTYEPEILFMAHRDRFAKSLDGGNSWNDLPGPWRNGRVLVYRLDGEAHLMAVDTRHATNLLRVYQRGDEAPEIESYTLDWPEQAQSRRDDIRQIMLDGNRVFVATPSEVLTGSLPSDQQKLPDALALIATIGSMLLLIGVAFSIVKLKT